MIVGWPGSAAWTLGHLVGVNLITPGLAIFMPAATTGHLTSVAR